MTTDWSKISARLEAARQQDSRRAARQHRLLLVVGHPVVVALLAAAILAFALPQSWRSSLVIAAVIAASIVAILAREHAGAPPFRPFTIRIEPAWNLLAQDLAGLSTNDPLYAKVVELPRLVLTAVTPEMWYVHGDDYFCSRLKVEKRIHCGDTTFGYYVEQSIGGYEFGVITPESSRRRVMPGDNADHVEIAVLPYSEFAKYYQYSFQVEGDESTMAARSKYGWKDETITAEISHETDPSVLSHQYLWVSHQSV